MKTVYVWYIVGAWVVWSILKRRNLPMLAGDGVSDPSVNVTGSSPNFTGQNGQNNRWA